MILLFAAIMGPIMIILSITEREKEDTTFFLVLGIIITLVAFGMLFTVFKPSKKQKQQKADQSHGLASLKEEIKSVDKKLGGR